MTTSSLFQYAQKIDSLGGSLNEFSPRYFKTQKINEQNCGLHALNHIAQQEVFSREYLNSIEEKEYGKNYESLLNQQGYAMGTLLQALHEKGYIYKEAPNINPLELGIKYSALLCLKGNHWFSMIFQNKNEIYVMDSCLTRPERLQNYRKKPTLIWGIEKI